MYLLPGIDPFLVIPVPRDKTNSTVLIGRENTVLRSCRLAWGSVVISGLKCLCDRRKPATVHISATFRFKTYTQGNNP